MHTKTRVLEVGRRSKLTDHVRDMVVKSGIAQEAAGPVNAARRDCRAAARTPKIGCAHAHGIAGCGLAAQLGFSGDGLARGAGGKKILPAGPVSNQWLDGCKFHLLQSAALHDAIRRCRSSKPEAGSEVRDGADRKTMAGRDWESTHFRLRLSCTTHCSRVSHCWEMRAGQGPQWPRHSGISLTSTLSQRQFPQGAPSTTSQRTFRARQDTQARAARRLVTFVGCSESPDGEARFLLVLSVTVFADVDAGEGGAAEPSGVSAFMMM